MGLQVKSNNILGLKLISLIPYKILVIIALILNNCNIYANNFIIWDSEINNLVKEIATPLLTAASLPNTKITVIYTPIVNAYATSQDEIVIHSGIITSYRNPDILRGIISHEIGHILGRHIPARASFMAEKLKSTLPLSLLLGLAAVTVGSNELVFGINSALFEHYITSVFEFMRIQEMIADKTGMELLDKAGYSTKGLVEYFNNKELLPCNVATQYYRTHPFDYQRLHMIRQFYATANHSNVTPTAELMAKYNRVVMKLDVLYSSDLDVLKQKYDAVTDIDIKQYAKSIILLRRGKISEALKNISELIEKYPNDPYYMEFKAVILSANRDIGAIKAYDAVLSILDDDLIRFNRAITAIALYPKYAIPQKYYFDLQELVDKLDNPIVLYYLSHYHANMGNDIQSLVNLAIYYSKIRNHKRALYIAKSIIEKLDPKTVDWYKVQDIMLSKQ